MTQRIFASSGLVAACGFCLVLGTAPAHAQVAIAAPPETVTYETIQPGYKSVTYGEKIKTRRFFNKRITIEKPKRFVTYTPPVVQETRVLRPAPIAEQVVVQPAPVVEERWVQPAPILERRTVQPPPVVETRLIPQEPVVQTRYLGNTPL